MKETISNNDKAFHIFNKLIVNGFYKGTINPEKIVFERTTPFWHSSQHIIILKLNVQNKFDLRFDYKPPMNVLAKVTMILLSLASIILAVRGKSLLPILLFMMPFLIIIDFKIRQKKELELFTSKYLELYRLEFKML